MHAELLPADAINPATHLSTSEARWRVIHLGMPLCRDEPSADAALAMVARYRRNIAISPWLWDGDAGGWRMADEHA